jgi:hypothetical protein
MTKESGIRNKGKFYGIVPMCMTVSSVVGEGEGEAVTKENEGILE